MIIPKLKIVIVCIISLLILFSFFKTPTAHACTCATPKTTLERLSMADAVFSGIVTNIDNNWPRHGYKITFAVEKIWKGVSENMVAISTGLGGGDCGYGFKEGQKYLVYAHASSDPVLGTGICSGTRPLESAAGQEDISVLGEGRTPLTTTQWSGNNLLFLVIAVLGIVFLKVFLLR